MELPRKVDVGSVSYQIIVTNRIPKDKFIKEKSIVGLCCGDTKRIWIKKGMPDDEMLSTFWHEILHALDFEYSIEGLTHEAIYELETPLAYFIADNPVLYKLWL
jgi:hypothetical protein